MMSITSIIAISLIANCCYGCFIRNCPPGGKKRSIEATTTFQSRQCVSCAGGRGQCVGPNICCGISIGCHMNNYISSICKRENKYSSPCESTGKVCGFHKVGKCSANGLCCTSGMSDSEEERPAIIRGEDGQLSLDMPPIVVPPLAPPVQSFDGSGPRLIITKIVNNNFKSYAGIKTLGPFHKSFSCIIGPNGSGKSNVIDSMLFVFGYRASKIRSKKISVLIHSSEEYPNIDSCSVEVHFQKILDNQTDEDDYEVVPESKFIVSRTAYRDNSSYYEINRKRATYKEVATMLKEYGIDLDHNRFLILQGEVEQIALMKPKAATEHEDGLLEYLEDIIGSSRFKQPIIELGKRVEALNDFRQEKLNRVKVVEREKADLEDVRNEAMDYLKLCNEVVKKKNVLYQKYSQECEVQLVASREKKECIEEKLKALHDEIKVLKEKEQEKIKENKEVVKQYETLQKKYNEGKERFSELEREDAKMRDELKYVKSNGKKLTRQKGEEDKKIEELAKIPEEANIRLEDLEKRLNNLQKVKIEEDENLKKVNEIAERETQQLKADKAEKEKELAQLQTDVNEKKSELKISQSELENILSSHKKESDRYESARSQKENIESKLQERIQDVRSLEENMPKNENSLKQANRDLQQVMEKEQQMNDELRHMRLKLEEYKSSFQASRSQNKVHNALMDLKRKGTIPGILGRLGDLGAIDDVYDIAISTACGPLENIVTDTIDTAQACVQFLKRHNVGHATFIGLDKMEKWRQRSQQRIETPEKVPRLFDLIRFKDERVSTAFYYALRDTLVARDLEQATRISYGSRRFRVVTLQGQLIETSGAMTGGGKTVLKGRMGSQIKEDANPEVMKKLEVSWESKNQEWQRLKANRMRLEEHVVRLNREVTSGRQSLEQYSMEIDRLTADKGAVDKSMKSASRRMQETKPDQKDVDKRKKIIASLEKVYEDVCAKSSTLKKDVDMLHKKIVEIIGERVGSVQGRLDHVNAEIDKMRKQMTKVRVSVKTAERNLNRAKEKVTSLEKEIEEAQTRLETLKSKLQELETEAERVIGEFRSAQEEVKKLESIVADKKKEIEALEAEEAEKKKVEVTIIHERDQVAGIIDENLKRIKYWNKEIGKLKLHYIEEEDETADMSQEDVSMYRQRKTKLEKYSGEELENMQVEQVDITSLEDQLKAMKPNMAAIEEYRRKEELYLLRVSELERVTVLRDDQRKQRENYKKNRLDEFMTGFHLITSRLKEMYQMITLGGDAELELVDSLDPFAEGIVFSVRPPKKSWKNISNLSGGEKTLSSLALVFALHHYKPTPLYVMDEIDAALDFKNVSIVAKYIQTRTKNAQFIIISLRSNMFEMADRLVGIYKIFNCTNSITVNPRRFLLTTAVPLASTENRPQASQPN